MTVCPLPLATPAPVEVLRRSAGPLPVPHESPADITRCDKGTAPAISPRTYPACNTAKPSRGPRRRRPVEPSETVHRLSTVPSSLSILIEANGSWECAVQSFAIAWGVPSNRRRMLRTTVDTPRGLEAKVGELFAEAAALALEAQQLDLARWCYEFCQQALDVREERPNWRTIEPQPSMVDAVAPPAAKGLSTEALVWWSLDLRPRWGDEDAEEGRRRTANCVLYLAIKVAEAFLVQHGAGRERAAILAVLGLVIAPQCHAPAAPLPDVQAELEFVAALRNAV